MPADQYSIMQLDMLMWLWDNDRYQARDNIVVCIISSNPFVANTVQALTKRQYVYDHLYA